MVAGPPVGSINRFSECHSICFGLPCVSARRGVRYVTSIMDYILKPRLRINEEIVRAKALGISLLSTLSRTFPEGRISRDNGRSHNPPQNLTMMITTIVKVMVTFRWWGVVRNCGRAHRLRTSSRCE